jgi:3D (Asp-Asp-Asp) domain-containing protein
MNKTKAKSKPPSASVLTGMSCSDGWFVTGYYTPEEDEFSGNPISVDVKGEGAFDFKADFVKHVRVEGWGKTRFGWFLGFDHVWIKSGRPLNARGKSLGIGSLAVDRSIVPLGTSVRIPTLDSPWNSQAFVADDTGGMIVGKHVDVYCGDGKKARAETERITANGQRICLG